LELTRVELHLLMKQLLSQRKELYLYNNPCFDADTYVLVFVR
jgi:hypothetical protein